MIALPDTVSRFGSLKLCPSAIAAPGSPTRQSRYAHARDSAVGQDLAAISRVVGTTEATNASTEASLLEIDPPTCLQRKQANLADIEEISVKARKRWMAAVAKAAGLRPQEEMKSPSAALTALMD